MVEGTDAAIPFERICPAPPSATCGAVIARMLDGLGFRFRWATEGLGESDYKFTPGSEVMTIGKLVGHVWGLANFMSMPLRDGRENERPDDPAAVRDSALAIIHELRQAFADMDEATIEAYRIRGDHPIWNLINGPLADALTHTGQINTLRRLAGNPTPKANVFMGEPPQA